MKEKRDFSDKMLVLLLISIIVIPIIFIGFRQKTFIHKTESMEEVIKDESSKIAVSRFTGEDFDVFMRYNKVIDGKLYLEVCDSVVYLNLRLNDTLLTPLGYNLLSHKYSYKKRADTTAIKEIILERNIEILRDSLKFAFKDTIK